MPHNKNAQLRYSVIDSCLQRTKRTWTFDDLREAIADKYREHYGTEKSISDRTLRADIANMKPGGTTGYDAPIEYTPDRGYKYTVLGYSIFQSPITLNDLPVLQQVVANLRQLLGFGLTDELEELVQRLEYRLSQSSPTPISSVIQFEVIPTYAGLPWLAPLYHAIRHCQVVELAYQPFQVIAPLRKVVHPHLIKQYNHRWFLLGVEDGQTRVSTFALDRIHNFDTREEVAYQPITIDPDTYFQHIIGSAVPENATVETIHLRFSASRAPYILTKPLHPSQEIIADEPTGMDIMLKLIPTRELMTQLLGFGADLQVLSPMSLQQEMQKVLQQSLEAYKQLRGV